MAEQRNIVILGASAAGLGATHYILKHILPALKAKNEAKYHVYTVAPSSRYLFRNATPRVAASTKLMSTDRIVFDLNDAFKQYSSEDFTFVEASATALNTTERTVTIRSTGKSEDTDLSYHALVVATGTKTYYPAFSSSTDVQDALNAIAVSNEKVQSAKKIVIAGGGATGVEFAGEVAEFRNGKPGWFSKPSREVEITLLTSDKHLLPNLRPALGKAAEQKLKALGVDVKYNTRVTDATPSATSGKTILTLDNGEKEETDLYVPAYGVQPNSSWLPKELLNDKGYLITSETLRVDAAGPRVYAHGDIASNTRNNAWDIMSSQPVLFTNLKRDLLSFNPSQPDTIKPKGKDRVFVVDEREGQVVPIGSKGGVGAVMGWKLPSFAVWLLKGRDYMLGIGAIPMVSGNTVKKEVVWTSEEAAI